MVDLTGPLEGLIYEKKNHIAYITLGTLARRLVKRRPDRSAVHAIVHTDREYD